MGEGRKEEGGSEREMKRGKVEMEQGRCTYVERKRDLILKSQQTKAFFKCKVMFDQKVEKGWKEMRVKSASHCGMISAL